MVSTDFNVLRRRLEAPRDVPQITNGTAPAEEALKISNPATWLRALVKQQKQAEGDLAQLGVHLCGNTIDKTDQRIKQIEQERMDTKRVGKRGHSLPGLCTKCLGGYQRANPGSYAKTGRPSHSAGPIKRLHLIPS